jgi:hypothetical protein
VKEGILIVIINDKNPKEPVFVRHRRGGYKIFGKFVRGRTVLGGLRSLCSGIFHYFEIQIKVFLFKF